MAAYAAALAANATLAEARTEAGLAAGSLAAHHSVLEVTTAEAGKFAGLTAEVVRGRWLASNRESWLDFEIGDFVGKSSI